jgi:hypothetical protein
MDVEVSLATGDGFLIDLSELAALSGAGADDDAASVFAARSPDIARRLLALEQLERERGAAEAFDDASIAGGDAHAAAPPAAGAGLSL